MKLLLATRNKKKLIELRRVLETSATHVELLGLDDVAPYPESPETGLTFEENAVTSDRGRFERTQALLKAQPFLRIFGPTFGWLGAALQSMRRIKRKSYAEEITPPLLVFGAGRDRVVRIQAIRDFVKHLPKARYVEIEDAQHEILMENDRIRARFWTEFDAFIAEQLGA